MSTPEEIAAETEKAVEMWKVKKLIKSLQLAKGYVLLDLLMRFSSLKLISSFPALENFMRHRVEMEQV